MGGIGGCGCLGISFGVAIIGFAACLLLALRWFVVLWRFGAT